MNELTITNNIEEKIYEIRGKQVMLDSDLARLYQCANGTKSINLAVKRHINKFPERYMFQLTKEEASRFQFETLKNNKQGYNIKYLPYVFTEEGVAMLATVLKTPVAEKISIQIMDAFVAMRKYISSNLIEQKYINDMVLKDNKRIDLLEETFSRFKEKDNHIFFDGQIYDAYSKIIDIFQSAKDELIIIDAYADKMVLDMISNLKVKVVIITRKNKLLKQLDINKYQEQYNNLEVIYNDTFHDRYFVLDNKIVYHCGTSVNYAGNKTFSINKLTDNEIKESLLNKIDK